MPRTKSLMLVLLWMLLAHHSTSVRADEAGLVNRALANEVRAASDTQHPMKFRLRKSSPRLTTTKEICETKDGLVARLVAINDSPLSAADEQREQARLDQLLNDPGRQLHRKQSQADDTARALKVLKSLPSAFLYEYAGSGQSATGPVEKFTFKPNPKFDPPDLETQVLTRMSGELWVDPGQSRVKRLEGKLQQDVDFGWGILGRLYKGGTIVIEQADVGHNQWRIVHFDMKMSARVVFKMKVFDTTEDESQFVPVPTQLGYQQGIAILRGNSSASGRTSTSGK